MELKADEGAQVRAGQELARLEDADLQRSVEELEARRRAWQPPKLVHKTPWEEIQRGMVGQLGTGGCLEPATLYLNILETRGESRHNH